MVTVQEQAIEWIHQALHFDATVERESVAMGSINPSQLNGYALL